MNCVLSLYAPATSFKLFSSSRMLPGNRILMDLVAAATFVTLARPAQLGPTRSRPRQLVLSAESLMHNEKKWHNASLEPRNSD